jgi:hypothetical protein
MGFRHKFAYSFFDFTAYKEFLVQGLGKSVLYIFLVTLIFSTITNFKTIDTFNTEASDIQEALVNSIPNFEFKNGVLSMDSSEPVYYKHNGEILIIDTVNKTNTSALDSYSDGIYVNSNELIYRQNYTTIFTINLTDYSELNFTNTSVEKLLLLLKIIFPLVLLIVNPIISFVFNLAAGFAIIGPLSFYAMTLPLLLEALLNISGMEIENFYVLFYILSLIYCSLALKEIKNIDKSNMNITQ